MKASPDPSYVQKGDAPISAAAAAHSGAAALVPPTGPQPVAKLEFDPL